MNKIKAWAATAPGKPLEQFEYDTAPLGPEEVEIAVDYCGICHSDLSFIDNEFGYSRYPFVPGHEIAGHVVALGTHAKGLTLGQHVGVGWNAQSCMHCASCLDGDQHMCDKAAPTMVGRFGGFAERIRVHWGWAIPLPAGIPMASAGPLLCAGITVFNPLMEYGISPTSRVGVVGIGGLGHLALRFARAWGCEVTAFTSTPDKAEEAKSLGAHRVVSSTNRDEIAAIAGQLDLIIVTACASLDWNVIIAALGTRGRLHIVGLFPEPIPVQVGAIMARQKSVSGSPSGSPVTLKRMLDFCVRHNIEPMVEEFPMSRVNEALAHFKEGKARYRVVLKSDFSTLT